MECAMKNRILSLGVFLGLIFSTSIAARESLEFPRFDLTITPESIKSTKFNIDGTVSTAQKDLSFILMPWHSYKFDRPGKPVESVEIKDGSKVAFAKSDSVNKVHFTGSSTMRAPKCEALEDEIYCMNNSLPNPEVLSDGSFYDVHFKLPEGYSALCADPDVIQLHGLEFQVANLAKPIVKNAGDLRISFSFPVGFVPDKRYLEFIQNQLEVDQKTLGDLPFKEIKVGAIRRGGSGEISGNASGNLILFSRTALGAPVNIQTPKKLDIEENIDDPLRKLIIAHELAHFWFGWKYLGQDGWMQEGIPQYIGLIASMRNSSPQQAEAIKSFVQKMAKKGSKEPIPNSSFSEDEIGYLRAYFQAPAALFGLGEVIGQDRLLKFLLAVYQEKRNPDFTDFESRFNSLFPDQRSKWRQVWQLADK